MEAVLAESQLLLSAEQLLNYQAILAHLKVGICYRLSGSRADSEFRSSNLQTALTHAVTCVERREALQRLSPPQKNLLDHVAALNAEALMRHKLARHQEAIPVYEAALAELRSDNNEENLSKSRMKVTILFNAIMSYRANGDFQGARKAASEGIEICRRLSEKYPLVLRYREDLARGYGNLAEVLMVQYRDDPRTDVLPELLVAMRTAAEIYGAIYSEYNDRVSMKGAAAVHYLRLAACLHWAERDEESLAEFRRCLSPESQPEQIEPGHMPNAYATATGFALLLAKERPNDAKNHSAAQQLTDALRIAEPMILDDPIYRKLYLNDAVFQSLDDMDAIASLNKRLIEKDGNEN